MKKVLIFPAPFLTQKTTADQQNDYMFSLLKDEVALERIGDFIEVNTLNKSDYWEEVRRIIVEQKPNWVIASGESATACINLHRQKKILINPFVKWGDLNNVPDYARMHTYGFFGALPEQEKSYELFQAVYPNASWFVNAPNLQLIDIKDIIRGIINSMI